MKVLHIHPPYNLNELYPSYQVKSKKGSGLVPGHLIPLGQLYIASYLRKKGHNVFFIDGAFKNELSIKKYIIKIQPDLLLLNISTVSWKKSINFISNLKSTFPNIKIVIGGPHPTAMKKECMKECLSVDFVCVGEGEHTMAELCQTLENKGEISQVKGIIFRKNNQIIVNPDRPLIKDLNSLPFPARDLVNEKKYKPAIGLYKCLPNTIMITSRGCPYACNFCNTTVYYRESGIRYRMRSIENSILEIKQVVKSGIKHIIFFDETFTLPKKRAVELCKAIIKEKIKVSWSANARIDSVDYELLKIMKKAGCWRILYGIESASNESLNKISKQLKTEQVKKVIKMTKSVGIRTYGSFILGLPNETYQDGLKTIEFACNLPLDYAKFKVLTPFPSTEIYKNSKKYGKVLSFDKMDTHTVSFIPYSMTKKQLEKLFNLSYKKFYMRPNYILRKFFSMRSFEDLKQNIKGFFAFFYIN
ncbi:radical SAM protein [archaeon]|jgi:anaerobic magnesium-protoporphyrin IX monomethyl ester cyclase|nr:radical SAM protein [Candidatus Woesearchaeota archaeon]MBT4647531.1 radical SAM protein [archaeon]MBT6821972.1 radical SAM protein [archaeon]MBT7393108.1 radical SAM protein [archaeon]